MDFEMVKRPSAFRAMLAFDARVDSLEEPRVYGSAMQFRFVLASKNVLRFQCIVAESDIGRIRPLIKKNAIINIEGAIPKQESSRRYNNGDVPFVFNIISTTKITVIKGGDSDEEIEDNSQPLERIVDHLQREKIVAAMNENTAALKELTAALRQPHQNT